MQLSSSSDAFRRFTSLISLRPWADPSHPRKCGATISAHAAPVAPAPIKANAPVEKVHSYHRSCRGGPGWAHRHSRSGERWVADHGSTEDRESPRPSVTVTAGANIAATIIGGMTGTTEGDSTELNRRVEKSALPALLLSANVAAVVPVQLVLTAFLLAPNFALVKYRSAASSHLPVSSATAEAASPPNPAT